MSIGQSISGASSGLAAVPLSPAAAVPVEESTAVTERDPVAERLYAFSVDQYLRMAEAGILPHDQRTELLEGIIVKMSPQGPEHSFFLLQVAQVLGHLVPPTFHLRAQLPLLSATSEPEPDLAIVRGSHADYRAGHPTISQAALVIEIADTSLQIDRRLKANIYATGGAGEYWILNLVDRTLEVYAIKDRQLLSPSPTTLRGEEQVLLQLDGVQVGKIPLRDLLVT
jgi:Uma2 family endonuclease